MEARSENLYSLLPLGPFLCSMPKTLAHGVMHSKAKYRRVHFLDQEKRLKETGQLGYSLKFPARSLYGCKYHTCPVNFQWAFNCYKVWRKSTSHSSLLALITSSGRGPQDHIKFNNWPGHWEFTEHQKVLNLSHSFTAAEVYRLKSGKEKYLQAKSRRLSNTELPVVHIPPRNEQRSLSLACDNMLRQLPNRKAHWSFCVQNFFLCFCHKDRVRCPHCPSQSLAPLEAELIA